MANELATLEKVSAWAKRRGFVYPTCEIYGGMANVYDFGPYGTQLKENVRQLWLQKFSQEREDVFIIDSSILLPAAVWEASGHTQSFADVMVEDKVSHKRYRADHLVEERLEKLPPQELHSLLSANSDLPAAKLDGLNRGKVDGMSPEELGKIIQDLGLKSPDGNELTTPKHFNQLFETEVGIIAGDKKRTYLRGEIAQGLFMNFKNILDSMHPQLPFGIGQAGKAFRNEITQGKFTYRTLEFDLMEFEYFFDSEVQSSQELFEYWKQHMYQFALQVGLKPAHLRWRAHEDFERSHYSTRTEDLEYEFTWGFKEMFGLAYRTDYDLSNHQQHSGKDLRFVSPTGQKIAPHVIEPTFGLSRLLAIIMFEAYTEEQLSDGKLRTVLKFTPEIAPVQVAVFPLQKDEKLVEAAKTLYNELKPEWRAEFDNAGNIGKMYRRQDEIGTPWCLTVDYQTLEDETVTVRQRDTMEQQRIHVKAVSEWLQNNLAS